MHILISNDDGIFAPGIRALSKAALARGHRVTVFAPDTQRSAASHSATLSKPIHVNKVDYEDGIPAYAVDGTPADCVRIGLYLTKDDPVDCVLSGVNNGANRGAAILYSGTVAAAMEGSLCGVTAVAASLCGYTNDKVEDFAEAARLGVETAEWAVSRPLPRGEIYNLNVPRRGPAKGVRAASVSYEFVCNAVYEQLDEGCYRMVDSDNVLESAADSDMLLNRAGWASLSVLTWNLQAATPVPDVSALNAQ